MMKWKKIRKRLVNKEFSQKVCLFLRNGITGYKLLQSDLVWCPGVCYTIPLLIRTSLIIGMLTFPMQIQLDNEKLRRDVRLSGSRLDLPQLCNGSRRLDGHNNHVAANENTVTTTSLNGNGNGNGNSNSNNNNNIGSPVSSSTTNSSNGGNERGSSTKSNSSSGSGSSGNSASSTGSGELKCNTPMTPSGKQEPHH